jgi:hypothetical protein
MFETVAYKTYGGLSLYVRNSRNASLGAMKRIRSERKQHIALFFRIECILKPRIKRSTHFEYEK